MVLAMVVMLLVGGMIIAEFYTSAKESAIKHTDQTLNSTITDNTNGVPNSWENVVTENRIAVLDNYGITNHFLQDNDNGICYWYQTLAVSLYDGVSSATVNFAYQVSDNSGLDGGSHKLKVLLGRPGGDNVTVWENLSEIAADNDTWYTQENTVTSYINATGTYTLYLFDNAVTVGDADTDNVVVRWDNASLTVNPWESIGLTEVGDKIPTVFKLLAILLIIIVAGIMLKALGVM